MAITPKSGITIPRRSVVGMEGMWAKMWDPPRDSPTTPELLVPTNPVPAFMATAVTTGPQEFQRPALGTVNTPTTVQRTLLNGGGPVGWDGKVIEFMLLDDPDFSPGGSFPGPTVRIPRGTVFHGTTQGKGPPPHTIHWHGIEPTPMNDGVGKHSFEVSGPFDYQFQPRFPGTYFYHCHKNTPLHFEMGLYGMLLVDPPDPAAPNVPVTYPTGGPGFAARFNPLALKPTDHAVHYDVEAFWVPDSIDSRWHTLGHNSAMQKTNPADPVNPANFSQDGILNDFRPDIFLMTGIPRRNNDTATFTAAENPLFGPLVAPTVKVGQTLLIRVLNADYLIHRITLGTDAEVIAMDGRALGVPPFMQYNRPFPLPAGTPFKLTSAMRNDLIVKPTTAGTFPAMVEFLDQITGKKLYTAKTTITVTP
jgi:FtsP/CotA-like multicopper oxidase with cupredoxin domain